VLEKNRVAVMSLDSCDLGEKLIRVHAILKCDFGYEYFFEVFDKSEKIYIIYVYFNMR
jgi:hypothetical protein